jgi:hypothetical protein
MPIPTGEHLTIHTTNKLLLTTYSWTRGGFRPTWTRRWPAFQNGQIARNTVAYGDYLADLCNQYGVDVLSGYYQAQGENPLPNFRNSLWATSHLGRVKLCHMAGLIGFGSTVVRATIEAQVKSWWSDMLNPKYARIRVASGASLPIVIFWGNDYVADYNAFVTMLNNIRTEYRNKGVGEVFIMLTEHICGLAGANIPGAVNVIKAVDGVYHHPAGLPWETCGGCDKSGVEWTGTQSATQLAKDLNAEGSIVARFGKYYMSGGMTSFDRDLFERDGTAVQGRVVVTSPAELRTVLRTIKNYARPIWSESQWLADGEHIYEDVWSAVTSCAEWEEGSTVEPCVVRGTAYTAPYWDYGTDRMAAIAEVFRETVRRAPISERPTEPQMTAMT